MADEISIGDENLISSKRAAELSSYAQDYIGQLARKGLIQGKRIGGLWYISLESLNAYKSSADLYTPRPPQPQAPANDLESTVTFDGRDYISASRAAKITGYHPDYVGQLARSGKILSRQIGNRWYVDRERIVAHKEEKDALLGAVQSQSTGVSVPEEKKEETEIREPFFTYQSEGRDLIPKPINSLPLRNHVDEYEELENAAEESDFAQPIAIHKRVEPLIAASTARFQAPRRGIPSRLVEKPQKREKMSRRVVIGVVAVVLVLGIGFTAIEHRSSVLNGTGSIAAAAGKGEISSFAQFLEGLFGRTLYYQRSQ